MTIFACGGGGGSATTPEPPLPPVVVEPEPAFSLTLRQETTCDPKALLPNVSVLVYEQSPLLNYNTPFTSYTTDSNGRLELDIPAENKISFSINTKTVLGSSKVYTFNELDVGNYDLTILFFEESEIHGTCSCQTVAFDAELNTGASLDDISSPGLYWGNGLDDYDVDFSDKINFSNVSLCGSENESLPVAVKVSAPASGLEYYGHKNSEDSQDFSMPIAINSTVLELVKPDRGEDYEVISAKTVGSHNYFTNFGLPSDSTYKTYPDFTSAQTQLTITATIPSSYNGIAANNEFFTAGLKRVREGDDTDTIDGMPSFPIASYIDMLVDEETRLMTVDTDATIDDTNINYTYIRNVRPNGEIFRWYIYSPNSLQVSMPLLEEPYETEFSEGGLTLTLSSYIKVNNATDFTQAITNRRFNDLTSGERKNEFSETNVELLYREYSTSNKQTENKTIEGDSLNRKIMEEARDNYSR